MFNSITISELFPPHNPKEDDIPLTKNKQRKVQVENYIKKISRGQTEYLCKNYDGRSYCGCLHNGGLPKTFNLPNAGNENAENFFKVATLPMCGNSYFDHMKQCALVC
ncbi:hypothetical protein Mgra_00005326 [Meloidogyne graminicola]|uniref:Uncharacterized protein n=1 Tax=Meloidogyne graminicola TaxID=189291 RepID=A0A8S9ZPM0_9BILA|nr:hypothetical protein Mgra_00005326 [Meloidogyne graminicola]